MKSMRLYAQGGLRRYLLVMDAGDEACAEIVAFARDRDIRGASLTAIGAASRVVLGYFDPAIDDYEFTTHDEQVELASFVGDIAWGEGGGEGEGEDGPVLHAHGVLGRKGGSALAGHFRELHVFPTMEVMLIETPAHIRKARDAETGLELISIERSDAEGERAVDPSLPRGVGHIGVTVPDVDEATAFFRAGFGGKVAYDGLTRDDPPRRGREVERQHGLVNVVCSKGVWDRYRRVLRDSPALIVRGMLERSPEGVTNLLADAFEDLRVGVRHRSRDFR